MPEVNTQKPGTPEELVHFGVKGMRWGQRNRAFKESFSKSNPTRSQKNAAIQDARHRVRTVTPSKVTPKDRAIASRLTTGEKTVLGILALSGVATLPIVAFVGVNSAIRRHDERRA